MKGLMIATILASLGFCTLVQAENCKKNAANFDFELEQPFYGEGYIAGWGPLRLPLMFNPRFEACMKDSQWLQQRILAAADFWIRQKLNYCHHYVPNYATPPEKRNARYNQGGYCSAAKNLQPLSPFYKQAIRWNYSGQGVETQDNWINNTMWYGMDCSNYTTFLYNFALGMHFSSKIEYQAGQGKNQQDLSPNQQTADYFLNNPKAAGQLVCSDNTLETEHSCAGHGGYISVIDANGIRHKGSIKANDLATLGLKPGDLLFIAAAPNPAKVTHVVMWTGKQAGNGPDNIPMEKIAPNGLCPEKDWQPHSGDWVITDSHYQGADYRILTPCFYLNNLWGVRRVIP